MKKVIYKITIILLIGTMLISSYFVFKEYKEDKEQNEVFQELQNIAIDEYMETDEKQEECINLQKLYELNNDFVGWLRIDDTNMSYPIMQSKGRPNYYLNRNFYKKYSSNGTPYIAENCELGKSDNLIIYGHHINGKRVFGELENYKKEEYYKEHKIIKFYTLEEQAEYEIIAVFKTISYSEKGFDYYNYYNLKEEDEFDTFIKKCKELCFYKIEETAKYGDKLITLSTCEYSHKNRTFSNSCKKNNIGGVGMTDIKIKQRDKNNIPIKRLDKKALYGKRIKNNIINLKEKAKKETEEQENENPTQYGMNKIENKMKIATQKGINTFNKYGQKAVKETGRNIKKGTQTITMKMQNKTIKTTKRTIKEIRQNTTTVRNIKLAEKTLYKSSKQTLKLAKEGAKKTYQVTKATTKATAKGVKAGIKATITTIKAIATTTKAIASALLAGGWIALVIIIVLCIIGGACALLFGGDNAEINSNSIVTVALAEVRKYGRREVLEVVSVSILE